MKENSIKNERSSIEEDIKDIEKYISFTSKRENFSHDTDWNWNKDLANKIEHILSDYKRVLEINEVLLKENEELNNIELKSKGGTIKISLEGVLSLENKIKQLEKENFDLKNSLSWRITYCQELEKDLFENCENFVISKDKIKEQIKRYAKLSDDFYDKWKKLSPFDEEYKNIRDKGMCCDAIVNVLQELLKG